MKVNFKLKGIKRLERYLMRMQSYLANPRQSWARTGVIGLADINSHFTKSQGPDGKWEALKHRKGKPLMDTGRLRGDITYTDNRKGVTWWTDLVYAKVHNYGYKKKNIPKREFMWLSRSASDRILNVFFKDAKNVKY